MKNALWLYLYLLLNANRTTGLLMRKIKTASADMGVSRDSILRWLKLLRKEGYVSTHNSGRYLTIRVNNWKPLARRMEIRPQQMARANASSWKYPTPLWPGDSPIPVHFGPKSGDLAPPKEMERNKLLNNETKTMQDAAVTGADDGAFKSIGLCARRELLAWELARALNDSDGISFYRSYCQRYPEKLLRKALHEASDAQAATSGKSRITLFTQLLQRHVQRTTENPGG
jgi:hypothetical protein